MRTMHLVGNDDDEEEEDVFVDRKGKNILHLSKIAISPSRDHVLIVGATREPERSTSQKTTRRVLTPDKDNKDKRWSNFELSIAAP